MRHVDPTPHFYDDAIVEAVAMYLRRQARTEHPQGTFDRKGRFYLSEVCGRECSIRTPTRAYPYSQMLHGRTLIHCAHALGVSRTEAGRLLREIRRTLQTPDERLAEVISGSVDDELSTRLADAIRGNRKPGVLRAI